MPATQPYLAQNRRRALAELDLEIDRVRRTRERCLLDVGDTLAAGRSAGRANAMLRMVDERLALLQGSRAVLIEGEVPPAAKPARAVPA